jgi:hypothetical protein
LPIFMRSERRKDLISNSKYKRISRCPATRALCPQEGPVKYVAGSCPGLGPVLHWFRLPAYKMRRPRSVSSLHSWPCVGPDGGGAQPEARNRPGISKINLSAAILPKDAEQRWSVLLAPNVRHRGGGRSARRNPAAPELLLASRGRLSCAARFARRFFFIRRRSLALECGLRIDGLRCALGYL